MGLNIFGTDNQTKQEVDPLFSAARVTVRPAQVLAWNSGGAVSGSLTTVAANAPIFTLRNTANNLIMLRRLSLGWLTTTAFTAAQRLEWGLYVARGISAGASGGTDVSPGQFAKHRASLAAPNVAAMIATTTGLTAGTRTVDTQPLGILSTWVAAIGATLAQTPIFSHDTGDLPLLLASGEGLEIQNRVLMGAAGVGMLYVNVEYAEAAAY